MLHVMTAYASKEARAMRHDPAGAAIVIVLHSRKMPGIAQAVQDLMDRAMVRHSLPGRWLLAINERGVKNNGEGSACI
jgi:hypothetical protein